MKTDPKGKDIQPDIGSVKRMKGKAVSLAVSIPFILALILSFIDDGSSGGSSNGQRLLIMVGLGFYFKPKTETAFS